MFQSLFFLLLSLSFASSFYFKRTPYGDENNNAPDYINAYYGFPSYPSQQDFRRRPTMGLYPPQGYFRREHPFDFGPVAHRNFGDANEEKTDRELAMVKAKPGFWRQNGRGEAIDRIRKIIDEKRMNIEQKHHTIRKALSAESDALREKFADLHKRLVMKNNKMVASVTSTEFPQLSKQAKKLEREAMKIMQNKKMSIETKQAKLDKLMVKAPENVKSELEAINDSNTRSAAPSALPLVQYPSQQSLAPQSSISVVESKPIRVSEDGQTVEI